MIVKPAKDAKVIPIGIFRFDQIPNLYSIIGLAFIITGVLMVNLLGNN